LGKKPGSGDPSPAFSQHQDDKGRGKACLLSQLFSELSGDEDSIGDDDPAGQYPVWFETYRMDCMFVRDWPKIVSNAERYPEHWVISWCIEVENEFSEFAHTLRTLLDLRCLNRLGIFFRDEPVEATDLTALFQGHWEDFRRDYTREERSIDPANLRVIVMPEKEHLVRDAFIKKLREYLWIDTAGHFEESLEQ
jgi:hypothetical protein